VPDDSAQALGRFKLTGGYPSVKTSHPTSGEQAVKYRILTLARCDPIESTIGSAMRWPRRSEIGEP
ncbi:uncharacterized protein METZ01_LOCUS96517, partial [marine metagenome]